jgi:ParB family chromosome partitioning protein
MKKPSGLGRGLSALIDEAVRPPQGEQAGPSAAAVRVVEIGRIRPNPLQPRQYFDEAAIDELASSIEKRGVLQPILLRPAGEGYEIVAGERRWRAAQKAQLHEIPAIIRDFDEGVTAEVALIENVQREDLSAIEEAQGYRQLVGRYGHTQEVVARLVGKSRSHVTNLLRLLELPDEVQEMVVRGDLSMGHARAIATSADPVALAGQILSGGLSVRQAEHLARKPRKAVGGETGKAPAEPTHRLVDADLAALERQLGDLLGLRVKVAHGAKGGTVSLHYSTLDQLDLICQRLSGEPI